MVFISFMIAGDLNLGFSPDHVGIRSNLKVCYLYPSYGLSSQTEVPEEKSSGLKKAGVIGLEFVGASVGTLISLAPFAIFCNIGAEIDYWNEEAGIMAYSVSNFLVTSTFTAGFGKILGEKGNWWHSAIGAGIGGLLGSAIFFWTPESPHAGTSALFLLPPIGAVIGFNLK